MILLSTLDQYQFASYTDYDSRGLEQRFINKDSKKNTVKTNDIIKKEYLDKAKYEAEPPSFFFF